MYAMDRTVHFEHRTDQRTRAERHRLSLVRTPAATSGTPPEADDTDTPTSPVHEFID